MQRGAPRRGALALLGLLLLSCGGGGAYVWVRQDQYQPTLPLPPERYRDATLCLRPARSELSGGSQYYFYSRDGAVTFEGSPTVAACFGDAMQRALESAGLRVQRGECAAAPSLELVLTAWDDQALRFRSSLSQAGRPLYQGLHVAALAPPAESSPDALRRHTYALLDGAAADLLADPRFRQALLGD